MFDLPDPVEALPSDPVERVLALRLGLVSQATGGTIDHNVYRVLRAELMQNPSLSDLLPRFVRTCQSPDDFWQFIKAEYSSYAERRTFLREQFAPLLERLEMRGSPTADLISDRLNSHDAAEVGRVWEKALSRCAGDAEGAVTSARTLLESVCMHILDEFTDDDPLYRAGDDLPKLYRLTAEKLNLAPSQHTEQVFKQLLGGCVTVVEGIGAIRNRLGDAHGKGKRPVRIAERHAHLVVNLAGSMALYLVETAAHRLDSGG